MDSIVWYHRCIIHFAGREGGERDLIPIPDIYDSIRNTKELNVVVNFFFLFDWSVELESRPSVCVVRTSSRSNIAPRGGATVMKAHGTIRLIPANFAASSSFFCCRRSWGPMALIRTSTPDSAVMRSLDSLRSMQQVLMPCSWIFWTEGLFAEAGRTKTSTSYERKRIRISLTNLYCTVIVTHKITRFLQTIQYGSSSLASSSKEEYFLFDSHFAASWILRGWECRESLVAQRQPI